MHSPSGAVHFYLNKLYFADMIKSLLLYCLLLLGFASFAQDNTYYVVSTTEVYRMPDLKARKLGVYARGGKATFIKNVANNWAEIITENNKHGYVQSQFIAKSLNANDSYKPDPAVFMGPDDVMGCPHLYVTAAGVRTRAIYKEGKPLTRILRTNEPLCISYLPYDENDLVLIEGNDKDDMIFTQRKFLGPKLDFLKTVQQYKSIPAADTAKRKTLIERIYEMSWREDKAQTLEAVNLFIQQQIDNNQSKILDNLVFEKYMLEQTHVSYTQEELEKKLANGNYTMKINGIRADTSLSLKQIKSLKLPYKVSTSPSDMPEVGPEADKVLKFDAFNIYYNTKEDAGYIEEVNFIKPAKIEIEFAGQLINNNTTEKEFLKKFGKFIYIPDWLNAPHVYHLNSISDGGNIVVTFKNGSIESFGEFYCC